MVTFSSYFGISFMFWIFWPAEAKILSKVGVEVTLACSNNSLSRLKQLTWKMNGSVLFTIKDKGNTTHNSTLANELDLKVLNSESELYRLVIRNTQKSHEGNYTCETTTEEGFFPIHSELVITDPEDLHGSTSTEGDKSFSTSLIAIVAAAVFAFVLIIIGTVLMCFRKRKLENENAPPVSIRQQPEEIYENHLEIQRYAQASRYKHLN